MNTPQDAVKRAREIATSAHQGQTRWDGKTPYLTHPEAVASAFDELASPHKEMYQTVSLLHDVVEDNKDWTIERLTAEGFSETVVFNVDLLTHREGESYLDYILRLKRSVIATEIKKVDIQHNLSTAGEKATKGMINKWQMALWMLDHSCYKSLYNQ